MKTKKNLTREELSKQHKDFELRKEYIRAMKKPVRVFDFNRAINKLENVVVEHGLMLSALIKMIQKKKIATNKEINSWIEESCQEAKDLKDICAMKISHTDKINKLKEKNISPGNQVLIGQIMQDQAIGDDERKSLLQLIGINGNKK